MTTHTLTLSPSEVLAALRGELGLVVRPVKPQPTMIMDMEPEGYSTVPSHDGENELHMSKCPLGVPGDRLVCKEPHYIQGTHGQHRADGLRWGSWSGLPTTISPDGKQIVYYKEGFDRSAPCWRSHATMPAWASRITLEVVGVRCVRCGDITYEDAEKAGVADVLLGTHGMSPLTMLRDAWNRRYGKRYPWESNPWCWCVEVKGVEL